MASKPLQGEVLNQVVVTMGAEGFQGEESSVWVELGEGFVGAGRRKPFPGVEQLRVSSEQSRE